MRNAGSSFNSFICLPTYPLSNLPIQLLPHHRPTYSNVCSPLAHHPITVSLINLVTYQATYLLFFLLPLGNKKSYHEKKNSLQKRR